LVWMFPIPGSKNKERIIEKLDASKEELTEDEFRSLEEALNRCKAYGGRQKKSGK
jgi:diketogulonate reductase-like aldo/keto reductase